MIQMNVIALNNQIMLFTVPTPIYSTNPYVPAINPLQCIPFKPAIRNMNNAIDLPLFVSHSVMNNLAVALNPATHVPDPQQFRPETYTASSYVIPGCVVSPHPMYMNHQSAFNPTSSALVPPVTTNSICPPKAKTRSKHNQSVFESPPKPIKPVWSCSICFKNFTRKSNLTQHLKIHSNTRDFICPFCSRGFRQKHTMIDHIRTHTGERPFKCSYCPKAFKVKHNLKTHVRLHTGERPYSCAVCVKPFVSKSSLNAHVKSQHH
eukprot:947923_1